MKGEIQRVLDDRDRGEHASPESAEPCATLVVWICVDLAYHPLSQRTLSTLVCDSKPSVTAGFLEILENQYYRKVPPSAILFPVTTDGGARVKLPQEEGKVDNGRIFFAWRGNGPFSNLPRLQK